MIAFFAIINLMFNFDALMRTFLLVIITLVTYTKPSTLAVANRMVIHKNVEDVINVHE